MIISFPPRNKRKRRQHWIIIQSKTIKWDFEVVALPNLTNTSGVEMVFWAQPTGAVGPLCRGPRGRAHLFQYRGAAFGLPRTLVCVPTHRALQQTRQSPQPFHSRPRVVPWSHPCIKTSWVWVRRGKHSCSHIICSWLLLLQPIDHCVNKHNMNGTRLRCSAQRDPASAVHSKGFESAFCKYFVLISWRPFDVCLSRHLVCARALCCIKRRLSISQLKSCSQDSFPAGLRSSVVPLHPVDFRSTQACQTEYTLIAPDWDSRYFFSC